MEHLFTVENLIALLTLTSLEIVLGIDNIVFIAILSGKLDKSQQAKARNLGLLLAMVMRVLLLLSIKWVMGLTQPLFSLANYDFSGRDLILFIGGLFLIGKSTTEIHHKLEGEEASQNQKMATSFASVIVQIMLLDIVFSLDSVITAVGMAKDIEIMILAVLISVGVMIAFSGTVVKFIDRHPTFKILALSFLLLIGVMLTTEGFGVHVNKGYIYFAMAFSLVVEVLNIRMRKKISPVHLRN
ncbi:MAG: TerC family protein [Deltaproteobacteria bacterium]|nr:TerC family protein [Deltaproteobacteria bacterium]